MKSRKWREIQGHRVTIFCGLRKGGTELLHQSVGKYYKGPQEQQHVKYSTASPPGLERLTHAVVVEPDSSGK